MRIAGCVAIDGTGPSLPRLQAIRAALEHQGPDDCGIQIIGNVGLVHTRLAIDDTTDLARQPMHDHLSWLVDLIQRRNL